MDAATPPTEKEIALMDRSLDRIYAETDKEYRDIRPSNGEWEWAEKEHKPFTDRIKEIEWSLTYSMGSVQFVDLLSRWQKNVSQVLKYIRIRRTDPLA